MSLDFNNKASIMYIPQEIKSKSSLFSNIAIHAGIAPSDKEPTSPIINLLGLKLKHKYASKEPSNDTINIEVI